jgi:hypothetical protein
VQVAGGCLGVGQVAIPAGGQGNFFMGMPRCSLVAGQAGQIPMRPQVPPGSIVQAFVLVASNTGLPALLIISRDRAGHPRQRTADQDQQQNHAPAWQAINLPAC